MVNKNNGLIRLLTIQHKLCLLTVTLLLLSACASSGDTPSPSEDTNTATMSQAAASAGVSDSSASATADSVPSAATPSPSADSSVVAAEPMAPRIVESCKDEAYVKYEQQARASIKKGLEATKAGQFGVGFRDVGEHNKWSNLHNELFKSVAVSCDKLSQCAKQHAKDKDTECVNEARTFGKWQALAKSFTEKVKSVESTQPPQICSIQPSANDPSRCFAGLADNIDAACETEQCREVSACWRSVGFLDIAINQAESSCGFVHQKLENCRAYTEATMRRKTKFENCTEMQNRINLDLMPVL